MADPQRRVALITNAALIEGPDGLLSPHSSVRREIVLPARALQARGVSVHVISLEAWPSEQVAAIVEKADRIVFGSILSEHYEAAYRDAVRLCGEQRRLIFFVGDHERPGGAFYREMSALSQAWLVRSRMQKESLEQPAPCPVYVYPTPAESERGKPRVTPRGLRMRAGAAIARRYRIGLDPWRLKLLWIGDASDVQQLVAALPELHSIAARTPLMLECLTEAGTALEDEKTPPGAVASTGLRLTVGQRTRETVAAALPECDAIILPTADVFIDALHAGRFVIATPHPAYDSLGEFACLDQSIAAAIRWLVRHPHEAMRRLRAGQAYVTKNHSMAALGRFWMQTLDFGVRNDAAPFLQRSREHYSAGDIQQAEELVTRALELDGGSAEAHQLRGNILQDQGKLDRAISCYRRALRLDAELAAAHNDLGTAYVAKGWYAEAIECYLHAVNLEPANHVVHANLAQTLIKLGRRREALPHVRAALTSRLSHLVRRTLKISRRRSIP